MICILNDTLLLADVFKKFRKMYLKNYHFDSVKFTSGPGLAWEAALNLFGMGFFGAPHEWRNGQKCLPPENLLHISCNDEKWHGYTLPKENPKNI